MFVRSIVRLAVIPMVQIYPGPIGAVLSPLLGGYEIIKELPYASTLCAACTDACPVKIPLHDLLEEAS